MIEEYFNLSKAPFRLSIDSLFYYDSDRHRKALSYLQYGVQQAEGIVVVTGEAGVGKSMLIEQFLHELDDTEILAVVVSSGPVGQAEVLEHITSAFRINPKDKTRIGQIKALHDFFTDQREEGRQVLLIVDEAQNLSVEAIEEIRQLTNHTYGSLALLQVFLIGQPALKEVLARPDMEQLRQRVIASCELRPLNAVEVADYIDHRMNVSGYPATDSVFSDAAYEGIYRLTDGVPRKINTLCSRLLLQAVLDQKEVIDVETVEKVIADLNMESLEGSPSEDNVLSVLDQDGDSDSRVEDAFRAVDNVVQLRQEVALAVNDPDADQTVTAVVEDESQQHPVAGNISETPRHPASLDELAREIARVSSEPEPQETPAPRPIRIPQDMDKFRKDIQELASDVQKEMHLAESRMQALKASLDHMDQYRKGRHLIIAKHLRKLDQAVADVLQED